MRKEDENGNTSTLDLPATAKAVAESLVVSLSSAAAMAAAHSGQPSLRNMHA